MTYLLQNISFHEWLNQCQNFIKKAHCIENVNFVQFHWNTLLHVVEELFDCTDPDAGQMAEIHIFHVKQKNDAILGALSVKARVCNLKNN